MACIATYHQNERLFSRQSFKSIYFILQQFIVSLGDGTDQVWFDSNFVTNIPDGLRKCESPYGNFSSMKDALEVCERDTYCQMVYNENCDDAGVFSLCNKLEVSASSSSKACIYTKSKTFLIDIDRYLLY